MHHVERNKADLRIKPKKLLLTGVGEFAFSTTPLSLVGWAKAKRCPPPDCGHNETMPTLRPPIKVGAVTQRSSVGCGDCNLACTGIRRLRIVFAKIFQL